MNFAGAKIIPSILDGRVVYSVLTPDGLIPRLSRAELARLSSQEARDAADSLTTRYRLHDLYRMS